MIKTYPKEDLTIVWDPSKCTHSAMCFKGLREVFDPTRKPWITPEKATKEAIVEQVHKCPSGALSIKQIEK